MRGKPKKGPREKDLTSRYLAGGLDEDRIDPQQRFSARSKAAQQEKMARTALLRAEEESGADIETLPVGQVIQVYSLYSEVEHEGTIYLSVLRKTLNRVLDTSIVVGDRVRFRPVKTEGSDEGDATRAAQPASQNQGQPEAVIEQLLPRRTL